jgi:hypothetical protein
VLAIYQITENDLLEAQIAHVGSMFRISQFLGALLIVGGIGGLVFAKVEYSEVLVPIALGVFFLFRLHLTAKLSFKRDFANQGKVEASTSRSGIQFLSTRGTAEVNWSAFILVRETKNLFMLYSQARCFNIIPKRAFTPDDLLAFRQALDQNVVKESAAYMKKVNPKLIVFLTVVVVMSVLLGMVLIKSKG